MLEPNRWNYLEFEQPAADGAGGRSLSSERSLFLEIEGQERIYTGLTTSRHTLLQLRRHVPESLARRYQVLPIELKQNVLKVLMVEPDNQQLLRELAREIGTGVQIQAFRTTPELIQQGLAMYRYEDQAPLVILRNGPPSVLPPIAWVPHSSRSPTRVRRTATLLGVWFAVGILMLSLLYLTYQHWLHLAH